MAGRCRAGRYWDGLVKTCIPCDKVCKESYVNTRCISYCETAHCKAQPGHYYDALLKNCVKCATVCGGHPAECSQHCPKISFPSTSKAPTPPVTTTKFLVGVTSHVPNSRGISVQTDSTIFLYSLLVLCLGLMFSSLSLALAVLVRQTRAKSSRPRAKVANHNEESVVQSDQEVGRPWQNSKDFLTNSNRTPDHEPSYDSSPTETCVCVHCFPDLKGLGQANDRPPRAPFSYYPQPVLNRAQIENGGPVWTEGNLYTSAHEVQEEAAVG